MDLFFPNKELFCPGLTAQSRIIADRGICLSLLCLDTIGELLASPENKETLFTLLSEQEQRKAERFHYHKRQREWVGGRLAVKFSILRLFFPGHPVQDTAAQLSILPEKSGRPRLKTALTDQLPGISISHSSQFAVGMAMSSSACGIDIQEVTPRIAGLTSRFATRAEIDLVNGLMPTEDENTRLTMLWAAKEALKKSILHDQPSIFQGIILRDGQPDTRFSGWKLVCECAAGQSGLFSVQVVPMERFILAFTQE